MATALVPLVLVLVFAAGTPAPAGTTPDPAGTTTTTSTTTTPTTTPPPTTTTPPPTTTPTTPPPTTTTPPTAPAGPGATAPTGWVNPGGAAWVAFTLAKTSLSAVDHGGGTWGPVTITRASSAGLDLAAAFPGLWDSRPSQSNPSVLEYGWPEHWSLGSITLERADAWCDRSATSCSYYATGGAGQRLFFAAGNAPSGALAAYDQQVGLVLLATPVLDITFSWQPSSAAGANPGKLTLDARGTQDGLPGALTYEWTLTLQGTGKQLHASGEIAQFVLDTDGSYCVAVKVTNVNDPTHPATYGVTKQDCRPVSNVAPQIPGTGGGAPGGGAPSGGAGGGVGEGEGVNVVFAPPRRSSSALTGTAGGDSVVWLWRPEFFQPGAETTQALPQTGRNSLEGRTDIVIATDPAPDSNAAPMLAGLGIFGVVGVGWLFGRRRRIRAEF